MTVSEAQKEVGKAIREGILHRPDACSKCGKQGRIVAHHADYSQPLSVEWLCSPCHRKWHVGKRKGLNHARGTEVYHFKCPPPLNLRLREFAKLEGRTINNAIRRCVELALNSARKEKP